jgi:hypothetical protein
VAKHFSLFRKDAANVTGSNEFKELLGKIFYQLDMKAIKSFRDNILELAF